RRSRQRDERNYQQNRLHLTLQVSALAGARLCGHLSPQFRTADVRAIAPILKKVSPELLTITDLAVRVREPGFVPVEEGFRQGDRRGFERGSPADHADANG